MTGDTFVLDGLPGGKALFHWFGCTPRFHDAELLEITLSSNEQSTMRIHAWVTTDEVDSQGYFVRDKHVVVTITLDKVTYASLSDFHLVGIIADLRVTKIDDAFQISWDGSYGVEGTLRAQRVSFDLRPGKPEKAHSN